jgi:hypothetical protein
MVVRIFSLLVCLFLVLLVAGIAATVNAAQCGPTGVCPPLRVPVGKHAMFGPGPAGPIPSAPFGPPMMSGAKPMPCLPNCPPACPPPTCAPPACRGGFNPLSAIFSAVTLPFRLIGEAIFKSRSCQPPACPPGGFYPMQPPGCAPVCAPPAVKCRPNPLHAGYMNMPRPMYP